MNEELREPIPEEDPHDVPPLEADAPADAAPARTVIFENLTLAEALAYLFWRPVRTARLVWAVLRYDPETDGGAAPVGAVEAPPARADWPDEDDEPPAPEDGTEVLPEDDAPAGTHDSAIWLRIGALAAAILLSLQGGSLLHAAATDPAAHAAGRTNGAFWWFALAIALVIGVEIYAGRGTITTSWARRLRRSGSESSPEELPGDMDDDPADEAVYRVRSAVTEAPAAELYTRRSAQASSWLQAHTPALALVPVALLLSGLAWRTNILRAADGTALDVVLTPAGVVWWLLSVALWAAILLLDWPRRRQRVARPRRNGGRPWWRQPQAWAIAAALVAVTALGAYFRLHDLDSTPPEMTSDHIEKLLDALRVSEGHVAVFFPNNGGREGFQMWVVAFVADVLNVGFNFRALKLASAIEGILTLPVLWWMARQVIGTDTPRARRLGQWVGLALAGLVAISAWHVMLSRLGLRIVLTPLTTGLVVGFLARAMRTPHRMRDFVALGLTLGAGVYFYQANRMLPALAVIGITVAVLGSVHRWQDLPRVLAEAAGLALAIGLPLLAYGYAASRLEQSERDNLRQLGEQIGALIPLAAMAWLAILALALRARPRSVTLRTGGGLLAAAVVALALFVPMARYSALHPDEFWNRTRGRMFGEEAFWRLDAETGVAVAYQPSSAQQIERVWEQRDVLAKNYADALRLAHWEGDGAWINNAHSRPALDGLTGGLVILGLALWGMRLIRREDPVDWLLPAVVLVMLLPSALTLAYTIENPSFTRSSGTIPAVFMLAALPLGALGAGLSAAPVTRRRMWAGAAGGLFTIGLVLAVAHGPNWDNYFTAYRLSYSQSWKPYHAIAAPMKAFAHGEGAYGNAFMVAYPHWLDHRILGAVAGDLRWPNGLVTREELPARIAANEGTLYAYDPSRPLFVMVHSQDEETIAYLEETFPGGRTERAVYVYETETGQQTGEYLIYKVSPDDPGVG